MGVLTGSQASPSTVRNPEGSIYLYTKGADTVLFDRLCQKGLEEWTTTEEALTVRPCGRGGRMEGEGERAGGGGRAERWPQVCGVVMHSRPGCALPPAHVGREDLPSGLRLPREAFFPKSHKDPLWLVFGPGCRTPPSQAWFWDTLSLPAPNLLSPW